jgi:hypothetical protein
MKGRSTPRILATVLLGLAVAGPLDAQIGRIRDAAGRAAEALPDPSRLLQQKPPITTGLADARFAVDSLDNFSPASPDRRFFRVLAGFSVDSLDNFRPRAVTRAGVPVDSLDNMPLRSMSELQRTPNGGFQMQPGYYEMETQSYCLHAGTHGPGGGDGYLYAAPDGPAETAVVTILRNSVQHPEISQQNIQQLLWAIIARAKFEDLRGELKAVATQLLPPQELAMLNRSALDLLPGPAMDRAVRSLPPFAQQVLRAEAELRRMLVSADASFDQMERTAVLAGVAPRGAGSRDVPSGRWSRHPDGYYVRYIPHGYSRTTTQIWVPVGSPAVGKEFDPALHIAVPGNTARQRLIQSGRMHASR